MCLISKALLLAKWWALGCVNPAFWLSLAAGGEFTQPGAHLLADAVYI